EAHRLRPGSVPRSAGEDAFSRHRVPRRAESMNRNDPLVVSLIALGHATSHFMQLVLPPLFPLMREELGVTYATLGMVAAVFYAVSALLQPLAGFVVDRYGGRGVLLGGATLASLFGWHTALLAGAGAAFAVLLLLLFNMNQLTFTRQKPTQAKAPFMDDARVLLSGRVVACFLFFALHAAALTGLMSFGVAAMNEQFGVAATLASSAVAAYMVGSAGGMLLGGFVASRTSRPDFVA